MRVLVIDEIPSFLKLVCSHLRKHGFVIDAAQTFIKALSSVSSDTHDLIVLDLPPPSGDATPTIERLRAGGSRVPVIVLSAYSSVADRIHSLDAGADDYIVKPVDLDELVARMRAIARRGSSPEEHRLQFANIIFDYRNRHAIVDSRHLFLRRREGTLLELLLRHAGAPVRRELLKLNVYGDDEEIHSNSLDTHVHHLRRRLSEAGARINITTIRGVGYAMRASGA